MDSVSADIYFLLLLHLKKKFPFLFLSDYLCLIPGDCIYNIVSEKCYHGYYFILEIIYFFP